MSKRWTITVEEDPETGELVLPFSDEMLVEVAWSIGDTLVWTDNKDGSWTLKKKEIENEIQTNS
jgi:hypothetical protein